MTFPALSRTTGAGFFFFVFGAFAVLANIETSPAAAFPKRLAIRVAPYIFL